MKAFGRKTLREKVKYETEKYLQENYQELAYNAISGAAPYLVKQIEAMILYSMSLHGYGAKRLKYFHEWFRAVAEMPSSIMGKTPKAEDCENFLASKYGLNIGDVKIHFPTFEEFKEQSEGK